MCGRENKTDRQADYKVRMHLQACLHHFACFVLSPLDSLRVYFPIATRLEIWMWMCGDARGSYFHLGYIDRSITDQAFDMHHLRLEDCIPRKTCFFPVAIQSCGQ